MHHQKDADDEKRNADDGLVVVGNNQRGHCHEQADGDFTEHCFSPLTLK